MMNLDSLSILEMMRVGMLYPRSLSMLDIDPIQSESACLLAIENLKKKKICLNLAIAGIGVA